MSAAAKKREPMISNPDVEEQDRRADQSIDDLCDSTDRLAESFRKFSRKLTPSTPLRAVPQPPKDG